MKSPAELSSRWLKQWHVADNREQRLLHRDVWPIALPIGRPTPGQFVNETARVRQHTEAWRAVEIGEVDWRPVSFRGGTDPIDIPFEWKVRNPAEWIAATADPIAQREYQLLEQILRQTPRQFHRTLVRQHSLLLEKSESEISQIVQLAGSMGRGAAGGRPLRALGDFGIDSKFFERHRTLLIALLDARFAGEVSDSGLEVFLDALDDNDHWLLVAPLSPGILPFERQKVRAMELLTQPLPGEYLLVVENESSLFQLPVLTGTVAVLGAGFHLDWLRAPWVRDKATAYWGDLDTWGLTLLANSRQHQPGIQPLLMTREVFQHAQQSAVPEPMPAAEEPPSGLTADEKMLYSYLRASTKGRLEQEFLPLRLVHEIIVRWHALSFKTGKVHSS
jgi:hypothetical protein